MRSPLNLPFIAVLQNELTFNSRRIAPYVLMAVFAGNAVLWWGWSAASTFGWATNSDFNIVRNFQGFSFLLGLPLFNALIMGDPVIRDFNIRVDSLIFSKPISRGSYLLGKFCANFLVLTCCMAVFMLTLLALQWFPTRQPVALPARVLPYFKHFFLIVVISHLFLAAIFFTLATLKRSAMFAYGAALAFYPLYFAYQLLFLRNLPPNYRVALDPMLLNSFQIPRAKWVEADWINQIILTYSSSLIANRAFVVVIVVICLFVLCYRFVINEPVNHEPIPVAATDVPETTSSSFPDVTVENNGARANLRKLVTATSMELTLLRSERSLIVLAPLSILISFLALPWSAEVTGASHSARFAGSTARGLLVFLLGVVVFYVGEAMNRDREVGVQPLLWSTPVSNRVLLLSKFAAVILVAVFLLMLAGLTAVLTQLLRGQGPISVPAYLIAYTLILIPSLIFVAAGSILLNVLLRDKYLAYAISIAAGAALFYLYSQGFNHWLYNPVLYGLWTEADLAKSDRLSCFVWLRVYWLVIAAVCLKLAEACFARKMK